MWRYCTVKSFHNMKSGNKSYCNQHYLTGIDVLWLVLSQSVIWCSVDAAQL